MIGQTQKRDRAATVIVLWAAAAILALSRDGSASNVALEARGPVHSFLFAVSDYQIYNYAVGADGKLALPVKAAPPIAAAPFPAGVYSFVIHPSRPYAYYYYNFGIRQYRIRSDGQMVRLPQAVLPLRGHCGGLVIDPKGRFLYAIMEAGLIRRYRVAPDGELQPLPSITITGTFGLSYVNGRELTGFHNYGCLTIDPAGRFVYAYNYAGGPDEVDIRLDRYRVTRNGQFVSFGKEAYRSINGGEDQGDPETIGPVVFTPDGRFAYITTHPDIISSEIKLVLRRVATNGELLAPRTHQDLDVQGSLISIDPTGRFAVFSTGHKLLLYRIHSNGSLTLRSDVSFKGINSPTIDPTGRFLYFYNYDADAKKDLGLVQLQISPRGKLHLLATSTKPLPWLYPIFVRFLSPTKIAISPGPSTGIQDPIPD